MDFIAVPAIVVLCAFFGRIYKAFAPENKYKAIPELCGLLGLILGLTCFVWIPGFIPADNAIIAAAIGVTSGLASTGAHQIWKQNT